MPIDKDHLGHHCYICREDPGKECTNLTHARLYGFIASRGPEADLDGFNSATDDDMETVLDEMGFEECPELCAAGKPNGCYFRSKQTTTRVSH